MMISDEVMCGFGRTGKMFGFQHAPGVVPDLVSFAKGVTGAYIPLSGVAARKHIYDFFRTSPLGIGSTFFAHPMCMAVGYASVKHNMETNLLGNVQAMEPVMEEEMTKLVAKHKCVKVGRVHGLAAGFDL
jgi:taurine--2-oxoglutarate transaminase